MVGSSASVVMAARDARPVAAAAAECVEIRVYWGAQQLQTAYVRRGQRFVVGEGPAVDVPIASQQLGVERLELVNARGEVTMVRDGAVGQPQRLSPGERHRMSCGMLRFEVASTALPRMSPAERLRRRVQLMLPLLLAVVAVVVALPLVLPLALGHVLTPPQDEPTEEQRAHVYALMAVDQELDEPAPQAKSMVPDITVVELPPEAEYLEPLTVAHCSEGCIGCWTFPKPLELPPAVARYDLIELPHSRLSERELRGCLPRYDPFAESSGMPPELHGDFSPIPRCADHSILGPHAHDGPPSFIDWDVLSWPKRNPSQLSGVGIGDNAAARRSRSLATVDAPERWRQLDEIRFRTCVSASWHRYDRAQVYADCLSTARPTGS